VKRLKDWTLEHSASDVQFKNEHDAEAFLEAFPSKCSGRLWTNEIAEAVKAILPAQPQSNSIQVWNPGCGKGYESFSLACVLKNQFPSARIKIWANDSDIMSITNAPNLAFDSDEVPDYCKSYMVKGKAGFTFNQAIKDSVVFEYHDVTNANTVPEVSMIFCRDLLSYLTLDKQTVLLNDFGERLKSGGLLIVGDNEKLMPPVWEPAGAGGISAYKKA
jgi:purine-binding chemotaxis protein CheW